MDHWTDDPIFDNETEAVGDVIVRGDAWRSLQRLREEFGCAGDVMRVAGVTHYVGGRYGRVELIPEPTHPTDPNAIRVHIDGVHVGHVPRNRVVPPGPIRVLAARAPPRTFCWLFIAV